MGDRPPGVASGNRCTANFFNTLSGKNPSELVEIHFPFPDPNGRFVLAPLLLVHRPMQGGAPRSMALPTLPCCGRAVLPAVLGDVDGDGCCVARFEAGLHLHDLPSYCHAGYLAEGIQPTPPYLAKCVPTVITVSPSSRAPFIKALHTP